jgi:hypothetical protein
MTPLNNVPQSATRLGLPVIQTPASVDVVTQQTIQKQGYRTTTDTAQGAVGVLAGDSAGAPANFSMRGFSGPQVNVLYNGIWTGPTDITSRWMDTAGLAQVEFLKGPSSIMSGLNAIGGAVNYVNKQPTSGPVRNEIDASVDSFGSFRTHLGSGAAPESRGSTIASMPSDRSSTALSTVTSAIWSVSQRSSTIASRPTLRPLPPSNIRTTTVTPIGGRRLCRPPLPARTPSAASSRARRSTPSTARSSAR